MTMPKAVDTNDIVAAMDWIDQHEDGVPKNQRVRKFALLRDSDKNRQYPPKFVVRKAYQLAHGTGWSGAFTGGNETNNFLLNRGFIVWDRERRKFVGLEAVDLDPEKAFEEGGVLAQFRKHLRIERDGAAPRHAKNLRLKADPLLRCEVCGFSFLESYGDIGVGFIEAHHKSPLGAVPGARATRARDLALICSNCHAMLHRANPLLKPEELRELVTSRKRK